LRLLTAIKENRPPLSFVYRPLNVIALASLHGASGCDQGLIMRTKVITAVVILAISGGLFAAMRGENRADAAAGNCYASAQGPSAPTICE
jgi:hypothetical protein